MFKQASDIPYVRFLRRLHEAMTFEWYLEVGCRTGRTFGPVKGKTIAVDPFFQVESNVIGTKPALMCFQQTSDAFFDSDFLSSTGIKLSFSFLDGMHLVEYLLRDFINAERNSVPGAVAMLHDCCPFSYEMTTRDVENAPRDAWTGDVWKLIPILQRYRPDLELTVLGCRPTGLVLVHGLDPDSRVLQDSYEAILEEWRDLELQDYGTDRFFGSFEYVSAAEVQDRNYWMFDEVRLDGDTIKTPEFVSP